MKAAYLVFRETKRLKSPPERLELHLQGAVVELPQVPYLLGARLVLILTRSGVLHDTRDGAPLDEEGNPVLTSHQATRLLELESRFEAPRLATEAANEWFAEGEVYMRSLAEEEHRRTLVAEEKPP